MKHRKSVSSRKFTLIELLVVIAIIAILASILMPALSSARERGRGAACINNLKSLGSACQGYMDDYNGWLPRTSFGFPGSGGSPFLDLFGRGSINSDVHSGWFVYMSTASTDHSNVPATLPRLKYIPSDTSVAKGSLICPSDPNPSYGIKSSAAYSKFKISYVINTGVSGGSYNPGDQCNWMHINDFSRIPNKSQKFPSRKGASMYPLILDGGNIRSTDNNQYKTFYAKANHNNGHVSNPEEFKDPKFWDPGVYSPSGIGARHNASVNTVFVDGHAKPIRTPIFNTHTADSESKLRWLCPGFPDGEIWH